MLFTSYLDYFTKLILHIFHSDVHSAYRVSLTHSNCRHIFTFLFGSRLIVVPYCTRFCSPYGNQGCHKKHNLRIVDMSVIIKIVDLNARVLSLFSSLPPQRSKKRAQIHYCGSWICTWNYWHLDLSRFRFYTNLSLRIVVKFHCKCHTKPTY